VVLRQHLVKCNCVRAVVGLVEQGKDLAGFVMPMVCCHGFIFLILFTFLSLQEIKFSHNPHLSLSVDDWDVWMFLGRFPFEKKKCFFGVLYADDSEKNFLIRPFRGVILRDYVPWGHSATLTPHNVSDRPGFTCIIKGVGTRSRESSNIFQSSFLRL
jgi:hypothetical protein